MEIGSCQLEQAGELQPADELLTDPAQLRRRFLDDGVLLLRDALDPALVEEAREDLAARLRAQRLLGRSDLSWSGTPLSDVDPDAVHVGAPSFVELAGSRELQRLLDLIHGEPMHVYRSVNVRYSLPGDDIHVIPPHQDAMYIGPFRGFSSFWIALTEISTDGGGLALIPGSHRSGLRQHRLTDEFFSHYMGEERPQRAIEFDDVSAGWHTCAYHPGDLLVFDSHTIHTGMSNRGSTVRLSVDGRCEPAAIEHVNWQATWSVLEAAKARRDALPQLLSFGMPADDAEFLVGEMLRAGELPTPTVLERLAAMHRDSP